MKFLKGKKERKIGEETEEDYRNLSITVTGCTLFHLKENALSLNDEEIYQVVAMFERKFIESLKKSPTEDTLDIMLTDIEDLEYHINYLNPPNKEDLLKDLQKIREMIEGRNNKK